jgi:hypothetical protein
MNINEKFILKINNESQAWCLKPVIPGTQEADIKRIIGQGQPGQSSQDPITTSGWAMVACICYPQLCTEA